MTEVKNGEKGNERCKVGVIGKERNSFGPSKDVNA